MNRGNFAVSMGMALISSLIYGVWNILSYHLVRIEPDNILVILFIMMLLGSFFSLVNMLITKGKKPILDINRFAKYPILGGVFFAFGNIIFFFMIRNEVLSIVAAIVYSNLIIFSLLVSRKT